MLHAPQVPLRDYAPATADLASQRELDVLVELRLDEAEMLLHAGQAAVHRAHNTEKGVECLGMLAERDRVLSLDRFHLAKIPLHLGHIGADQPQLLQNEVCRFVSHVSKLAPRRQKGKDR
jgi:hypothetical protein